MPKSPISDQAIAVRTLELLHEDGTPAGAVVATLFRPKELENLSGYSCSYQICGIGSESVKEGRGTDAVQALVLTLAKIGLDLHTSAEAARLRWHGNPSLGFPLYKLLDAQASEPTYQLVL